jgi:hypothetical protein
MLAYSKHLMIVLAVFLLIISPLTYFPVMAEDDGTIPLEDLSAESQACISCHTQITPGIVEDWAKSEHSKALVNDVRVACYECHKAAPGRPDTLEHFAGKIVVTVTPKDCATCHPDEFEEFMNSKHAYAAVNGPLKPWYKYVKNRGLDPLSQEAAEEVDPYDYIKKLVTPLFPESGILEATGIWDDPEFSHANQFLGCMQCHGSFLKVKDEKLFGSPNVGVGRINPDGSIGSCSSCHTRHKFSIAEARDPETCGQCHMGPDHPQIEIYLESKHGNIYSAEGSEWDWGAEPWKVGVDFRAPTCATCHMSEIALPDGTVVVEGTHDVGTRLKWEIQSPFVFYQSSSSNLAETGLVPDEELAKANRENMAKVCKLCHSPQWVEDYFTWYESVLMDYNVTAKVAKNLLEKAYEEGLADKGNPLDEYPEIMWYLIWHHDGRRWRMGASMMGPDYTQWHGAVETVMDKLGKMIEWLKLSREARNATLLTDALTDEISSLKGELKRTTSELSDIKGSVGSISSDVSKLKSDLTSFGEKVEEVTPQIVPALIAGIVGIMIGIIAIALALRRR